MFKRYFRKLDDKNRETLLLISLSILLGACNVNQVVTFLGLPKTLTYNRVRNVSIYYWKQLLQHRLYEIAIPLIKDRLLTSASTKSRDGLILAVDDTVIARLSTELGYVWKWWSGQLKKVTNGQNVIALILVIDDIILPLDVRIVSKQGLGLKPKPEIYQEMLESAKTKFKEAGIDVSQLKTTSDAAYLSKKIAHTCRGDEEKSEPTITGIFTGKNSYLFTIGKLAQKAKKWKEQFREKLKSGWGTDGQPAYRTSAYSETFGEVILIFYIPKGKKTISYLIVVGNPLRSAEALNAFSFHHRIEEFWKTLKGTIELGEMKLTETQGAYACVALKIIAFMVLNLMKQNLRKLKRFRNVTINQLVYLCPQFVDVLQIFKEHFHDLIPQNYSLDEALT
jgi:hypothetical protein